MIGNNVSKSKRRTKRSFDVNLFTKKFYYVEQECWVSLRISAAGLRLINKVGLDLCAEQRGRKRLLRLERYKGNRLKDIISWQERKQKAIACRSSSNVQK